MTKTILAFSGGILMLLIFSPLYLYTKQKVNKAVALTFKGLSTFIAVLLSFLGALCLNYAYAWFITAGLLLCLIGDIVLAVSFEGGVIAFMLGHLCYIISFVIQAPVSFYSIIIFIPMMALLYFLYSKRLQGFDKRKTPLYSYAVVISAMLSIALPLPIFVGKYGVLTAAGALLFVASDMLLTWNILVKSTRLSDCICLTLYYAGQFLISLSVFLKASF